MEAMNNKLDKILDTMNLIEKRMNLIESKILSNTNKLTEIECRLNDRCKNLEKRLEDTVKESKVNELEMKVEELKTALNLNLDNTKNNKTLIDSLSHKHQTSQQKITNDLLAKDIYDKRFNLLFHGIEENPNSVWESKEESETKLKRFFNRALQISSSHEIAMADVHRLPQHPITKDGKRVTRPIICKLTRYSDKNLIMSSLKNLKQYNAERKFNLGEHFKYTYVTEHLPTSLQQQKKRLLPIFKNAKAEGKKAALRIQGTEYCLYINNVKYCD